MINKFREFLDTSHGLILSGPSPFVRSQLDKWRQDALKESMRHARYEERSGRQCLIRSLEFERWQAVAVCLMRLQMNRRTNLSSPFTDQDRASEIEKLFALLPDDPWVVVEISDCKVHRGTLLRHAKDPKKPYIEPWEGGKYRIRQSKLGNYLK